MSHFLNQDEFCAGNGFSRRSPSTDVTHAVGDAVDHEGGDIEMSQAFGPIAGGDPRDPLTSGADRIVGAVVGEACSRSDFILVVRISGRGDGAESPEHFLNDFVSGDCRWTCEHIAEHFRQGLPD
jgi:hypothetical protein